MSDPGLLAVSYRSLKSAPMSFFQRGCQVQPDNLASILLLNLLPGISRWREATQKEQWPQSLDKVLSLAQPFFRCVTSTVFSRAQLPHLSI